MVYISKKFFASFIILIFILTETLFAQANGFTVPVSHPRLWWNTERLAQAQTYYANHNFTPRSDDYFGNALRYALTGEVSYARTAIDWLIGFTFDPVEQYSSDLARWSGETAMVIYDWCYDQMTEAERDTIIDRWNYYIEVFNNKSWGGIGMEDNNYYQGFLRNGLEWGIISFHENPQAQDFLDHALIDRWENSFIPWAEEEGRGGVAPEGSQYGRYMFYYQVIPFSTVGLLGRDIVRETNFYKEGLFYIIYSTSQGPIYHHFDSTDPYYQVFPFSDEEFSAFPVAGNIAYGDFVTVVANEWNDCNVGQYARTWLHQVSPERSYHVEAVDIDTTDLDFDNLPLDYYTPGVQNFYIKNLWYPEATSLLLQLGFRPSSHGHLDFGSFQMTRADRWLTKETTGYASLAAGFRGKGVEGIRQTLHHNGIVFTGRGWTKGVANGYELGEPEVIRLESQEDYAYAVVDLSLAYQATGEYTMELNGITIPRDDNPFAQTVIREFIFIRALETLVVFDRLESKDDSRWGSIIPDNPWGTAVFPAENAIKSFLLHSINEPTIQDSANVLVRNGDQELRLTTVIPLVPNYTIVNDGDYPGTDSTDHPDWYQYRLEVSDSGRAQSYFLHILQARDQGVADLSIGFSEDSSDFYLTLTHATLGNAEIVFHKGMFSEGGQFGYSASGTPILTDLIDRVQGITVTDEGPVWENLSAVIEVTDIDDRGNPFNLTVGPTLSGSEIRISFYLPESLLQSEGIMDKKAENNEKLVSLSVYNILGAQVEFLINEEKKTGHYTLYWNTSNQPTGIYFVRLCVDFLSFSEKIILLR